MSETLNWQENSYYYPISHFYKQRFGEKVFKVPVAIATDCPNRMGIGGMKTCIFCDEWGSFAYPENQEKTLRDQIEKHMEKVRVRFNTNKFLIYFQAYTTTFTQLKRLKQALNIGLEYEGVVGVIIGTRPDCLSDALIRDLNELAEKTFVGVELGVQSFDNKQLEWMRRGHTAEQSIKGIQRLKKECPKVDIGVHLMFGWPGEIDEDIVYSAKLCNELKVDNVKLHNLHVLKKTPLEEMYNKGEFAPVELDEYCRWVGLFLEHLSPQIALHRLVAIAGRWEELVAPEWTRYKMKGFQAMLDYLRDHDHKQGRIYSETL